MCQRHSCMLSLLCSHAVSVQFVISLSLPTTCAGTPCEQINRIVIVKIGTRPSEENHIISSLVASLCRLQKERDNKSFLKHRNGDRPYMGNANGNIAAHSRMNFIAIMLSDQK